MLRGGSERTRWSAHATSNRNNPRFAQAHTSRSPCHAYCASDQPPSSVGATASGTTAPCGALPSRLSKLSGTPHNGAHCCTFVAPPGSVVSVMKMSDEVSFADIGSF